MLINKSKDLQDYLEGMPGVQRVGDKLVFTHQYDASDILSNAYNSREFSDNGWTPDREQRQVGCIPMEKFQQLMIEQPEVAKDAKALRRWLDSDEGAPYRTVKRIDTGRSGHCIVK